MHGHVLKTRNPPGTVMPCSPCGQEGRKDVTVTVPAPLPSVRPALPATPEGVAIIARRRTQPERWHCAGCLGSAPAPAPGEPPLAWIEIRAGVPSPDQQAAVFELIVRACSATCRAKALPAIRERTGALPFWAEPEPGPGGKEPVRTDSIERHPGAC